MLFVIKMGPNYLLYIYINLVLLASILTYENFPAQPIQHYSNKNCTNIQKSVLHFSRPVIWAGCKRSCSLSHHHHHHHHYCFIRFDKLSPGVLRTAWRNGMQTIGASRHPLLEKVKAGKKQAAAKRSHTNCEEEEEEEERKKKQKRMRTKNFGPLDDQQAEKSSRFSNSYPWGIFILSFVVLKIYYKNVYNSYQMKPQNSDFFSFCLNKNLFTKAKNERKRRSSDAHLAFRTTYRIVCGLKLQPRKSWEDTCSFSQRATIPPPPSPPPPCPNHQPEDRSSITFWLCFGIRWQTYYIVMLYIVFAFPPLAK